MSAPLPSPEEQVVIDRFGIFEPEQWDADRCNSWDHPVWADGSQSHFRCELPDGHGGEHIGDEGSWSW